MQVLKDLSLLATHPYTLMVGAAAMFAFYSLSLW